LRNTRVSTEATPAIRRITVAGIKVEVVRKDIKNLHLGVYPPNGRVRVAAPLVVSDEAVRLAIIDKLGWIKRQRAKFAEQPRQSQREMVNGESVWFLGQRYRLKVMERDAAPAVRTKGLHILELSVRPGTTVERRREILDAWYRKRLREVVSEMIEVWEPRLGVSASEWGIKSMRTKWGSCNNQARRLWINLEMAKKPLECIEYIVVHELIHLIERLHSERFHQILQQHLPGWRHAKAVLNQLPIRGEWQEKD